MELKVELEKKLKNFNLNVKFKCSNSITGIIGESGAGKSMLLKCIVGLVTPDKGRIELNGRTLFDSDANINIPIKDRKIGFLFQNYALFPHMTVEKNIGYALKRLPPAERNRVIEEMLNMMKIEELRKRYPYEISGGQQQRVALARALSVYPEVLLLDEPFSALDNQLRDIMLKQMSTALSKFKGETLFVTHNLEEAYKLCENLLIISNGKKVGEGNKMDLFSAPPTLACAKLTGCRNVSEAKLLSSGIVKALNWNIEIRVPIDAVNDITHIGIREQHIKLAKSENENTFDCYPVYTSTTPLRTLVYLKIHHMDINQNDYDIIWDMSSEEWEILKTRPLPYRILIDKEKIICINDKMESC